MAEHTIDDLPEEVLEFVLSLISPYRDLQDCSMVSKKWKRCVTNVIKTKQRNLYKSIIDFDVHWDRLTPADMAPTISKRYSHSAVVHDNSMYVFGGCTCAMTTFNDLWRLDLSKRQWIRPLAMGTYPSPKACSSLVKYKDSLVLFGGWAYPPSYPLYQNRQLFNELHVYDINANRWTCINTLNTPPPVAGHSVSIFEDWMIIFGGLQKPNNAVHSEKSNDIWKLNLETWTWHKQEVQAGPKPEGRFGQTQVILDEKNILILGGSGGPTFCYSDAWLLNMEHDLWKWVRVDIQCKENEPNNIWSNPGCRIGDKIVVLNRIRHVEGGSIAYYPKSTWSGACQMGEDSRASRIDLANRTTDKDENVNGKRGTLRNFKREAEDQNPGPSNLAPNARENVNRLMSNLAAFKMPEDVPAADVNRRSEQRLIHLLRAQMKYDKAGVANAGIANNNDINNIIRRDKKTHYLGIYVLDIADLLNGKLNAGWLPPKNVNNGPEETILYTLVKGKSELIMFGGIQKDVTSLKWTTNLSSQISNSLNFISAPSYVI